MILTHRNRGAALIYNFINVCWPIICFLYRQYIYAIAINLEDLYYRISDIDGITLLDCGHW